MMNRFFKASLSLILAITVIFSCCISFGATDNSKSVDDIHILNDTITLNNREIYFDSYNITSNNPTKVSFESTNGYTNIDVKAKDCASAPKKVSIPSGATYEFWKTFGGASCGGGDYNFDNTAGVYRKMRVKLSHYDDFNEDGSYNRYEHNFHFGDTEYVGKSYYRSCLIIVSGGVVTFVAPDKDGYIEFYAFTSLDKSTAYHTFFDYKIETDTQHVSGSGGGTVIEMYDFLKGGVSRGYVTIREVTEIQRYLSKMVTFDKLQRYRADVDNNNEVTVLDATRIQLYLARDESQ